MPHDPQKYLHDALNSREFLLGFTAGRTLNTGTIRTTVGELDGRYGDKVYKLSRDLYRRVEFRDSDTDRPKNAASRYVPTDINGRPVTPFMGVGKYRPDRCKAAPPRAAPGWEPATRTSRSRHTRS